MNIYLYVKTHNKTGLKYLGKTKKNPYEYKGSGKYWLRHIKKHGYDVKTEILLMTDSKEEIKETGLFFSNLWNIVENKEWANLMNETGSGGDNSHNIDYEKLNETKRKNAKTWVQSEESNKKRSIAHTGKKKSADSVRKTIEGKRRNGTLKQTEESKKKISKALKGVPNQFSKEHLTNVRKRLEVHNKRKLVCPHCNKEGQYTNMKRDHFDYCKYNPNRIERVRPEVICSKCGYTAKRSSNFYRYHNDNCNYE